MDLICLLSNIGALKRPLSDFLTLGNTKTTSKNAPKTVCFY
ncbi:hypothetical protein RINTU1_35050 [Candidatus Regiella insecticola]|uniref:Uncharacterized protein n=1 Tax=Candidatus Regiella insecticola TaxID=138073 RepID=A0A6L2ZRL7_9ENTR|nr:hypothetical protein RINTU1_34950 [Candidatus Regiella insecticola]GFN47431.1 hypothetical protein RINTU1_35050 [Candidatus Regiella insecticola]